MLKINEAGNIQWSSTGDYPNFASFTGSGNFTVPAGVTRLVVELWGAGGSGNQYGSGAGGGYICGQFSVTPGSSIAYAAGTSGTGTQFVGATGGSSTATVGAVTLTAQGGAGAFYNTSSLFFGTIVGGSYGATSGFQNYIGYRGQSGQSNAFVYSQSSSTNYIETTYGAKGGDAGNAPNTGGTGVYRVVNTTTAAVIRYGLATAGLTPGGGGGGHYVDGTNFGGSSAGQGLVVIRY